MPSPFLEVIILQVPPAGRTEPSVPTRTLGVYVQKLAAPAERTPGLQGIMSDPPLGKHHTYKGDCPYGVLPHFVFPQPVTKRVSAEPATCARSALAELAALVVPAAVVTMYPRSVVPI